MARESGANNKASYTESNYTTKTLNEFTIMNNEELKNWEEIQKYIKEKRMRLW